MGPPAVRISRKGNVVCQIIEETLEKRSFSFRFKTERTLTSSWRPLQGAETPTLANVSAILRDDASETETVEIASWVETVHTGSPFCSASSERDSVVHNGVVISTAARPSLVLACPNNIPSPSISSCARNCAVVLGHPLDGGSPPNF